MTVTAEAPAAETPVTETNGDTVRRWVGSLAAIGYPPAWTLRRAGILEGDLLETGAPFPVPRALLNWRDYPLPMIDALCDVYYDHRDQPAEPGPRTGLTQRQIDAALQYAAKKRFYPPHRYEEDTGRVLGCKEHISRRASEKKKARAYTGVVILTGIIRGLGNAEISALAGVHEKRVGEWRQHKVRMNGEFIQGTGWVPDRRSHARFLEIEAALDAFYADPGADPHILLFDLGIVRDKDIHVYRKHMG